MLNYLKTVTPILFISSDLNKRNEYCKGLKYLILTICLAQYCITTSFAQAVNEFDFERIEDNSFLIEEAYNQDPGVIQHISSFQYMKDKTWLYTFTDEWPVPGQKNQLSTTIPIISNGLTGVGDIALNYRYQAIFVNRFAFSPRFSLLFPSGNYKNGLGAGVPGYQLSLPFSYLLSREVVTHYNLGITLTPNAKNMDNSKSDITSYNYGLSIILLFSKNFNFMFEVAGSTTVTRLRHTNTLISNSLILNPGFRYAINCKSGLQIVPGIALPVSISSSKREPGIFGYLSFEHPLWKPENKNK